MQTPIPSPSGTVLADAFAAWAEARRQLEQMRAQLGAGSSAGQLGASPEAASLLAALQGQEELCAKLWVDLARLQEHLAQDRDGPGAQHDASRLDERAATPLAAQDGPVSILIVDDEPRNLNALEAVLEDPGYRLVRAGSADEALRALAAGDFACLLVDVQMPVMTGLQLARTIHERQGRDRTPIIFLTAHHLGDRDALEGYASGGADYLHKPFHPAVLRRKVEVFADLHRMRRQLQLRSAEREQLARIEAAAAAAAEAGARGNFLVRASRLLAHAPHFDAAIAAVLELCVPLLGERATIVLRAEGGATRVETHPAAAGAHEDAGPPAAREAFEQAIEDGQFRLWRGNGSEAAICPLITGAKAYGALATFVPAGSFDAARIELVREFASRAGIALENVRLNEAVEEAGRRRDGFLAMLAHELRNPLAPISNAVHIIRRQPSPTSSLTWACEVIGRQTGEMASLIEGLLDVARLAQGKIRLRREPVPLASIVERAVTSASALSAQRGQEIAVALPAEPLEIQGDPLRLAQALGNVLHNACKFSDTGATIQVTAEFGDHEVHIRVRDPGAGIPPEALPHVFDLFAQAEQSLDRPQGGLGVGLTLARHVVQLHGGRVGAYSDGPGQGSEFVLRLPARLAPGPQGTAPATPVATSAASASSPGAPVRVLVVDDQAESAQTLKAVLEINGFDACTAHDGVGALQVAEAFQPDVVLLDIGLPGLNGFDVARRLRAAPHGRDALLIALSGYGDADTRARSRQAGFDAHMTKPADIDRLLPMIADPGAARRERLA